MKTALPATNRHQISFFSIVPFLLISFAIAWGILALYIFLPDMMTAIFGRLTGNHPLFFLAVYAPAIAACIIILYQAGVSGLQRFLSRAFLWRCSPGWYAFLIVGIPMIFFAGAVLRGTLWSEPFPFLSFQALLTALVLAAIKGPVEEFGWRGFALPVLLRKFAPIWAGLILGVIWGFWHLPAFLLSGMQQSEWSFFAFFIGVMAISVIVTALFNASKGSILLSAVFHFNLMNPIFPDAQPYDSYFLIGISLVVVWLYRKEMFTKEGAVTAVIPKEKYAVEGAVTTVASIDESNLAGSCLAGKE